MKRVVVTPEWLDLTPLGEESALDADAANYVARVLRLRKGTHLELVPGDGRVAEATVLSVLRGRVSVELARVETHVARGLTIHLAAAIPKGERWEWMLQKATELGVTEITPLLCERSNVKIPAAKVERKVERWQAVCLDAMRQCRRTVTPVVARPTAYMDFVAQGPPKGTSGFVAAVAATALPDKLESEGVCWLVGPEGGFTEEEFAHAAAHGFASASLGPRVLRAETAATAAVTLSQVRWGDMR